MFLRVNLPDEIRDARERLHLSQVALAHRLDVSPRTVQGWEAGASTPQPRHRERLVAFLDEATKAAA